MATQVAENESGELTAEDHAAIRGLKAFGLSNARIAAACWVTPGDVDAALAKSQETGFTLSEREKSLALAEIARVKALEFILQLDYKDIPPRYRQRYGATVARTLVDLEQICRYGPSPKQAPIRQQFEDAERNIRRAGRPAKHPGDEASPLQPEPSEGPALPDKPEKPRHP